MPLDRHNVWTGIGILAAGLLFLLWMRLNPFEASDPAARERKEERPTQ